MFKYKIDILNDGRVHKFTINSDACEPECPVEAIFTEEDVPEDQQKYTAINTTRFGFDAPS